jgi:peptide-methionine (S)-S-oxide reductase
VHKKQYASAIIYVDDEQRQIAERSKEEQQLKTKRPITTYIQPLDKFYQVAKWNCKLRHR